MRAHLVQPRQKVPNPCLNLIPARCAAAVDDNLPVDISIIIPTRDRPAKLAECLRCLRRQTIPARDGLTGRFEVLVGIDGSDAESVETARSAWEQASPHPAQGEMRVIECPRSGLAAVRNRAMESARGRWILSINDDIYAEPGFIQAHVDAQTAALHRGRPAIVVGDSPWRRFDNDSIFDRMVRDTSMIFFYHTMNMAAPDRDWGFRHCFGLNFSVSAGALKDIGGFAVFPATYGYEDNEAAWRLRDRFGMPVLFQPTARGIHDHRYGPTDYLEREEKLGYAAWGFALQSPRCAAEMFGRDIKSPGEVSYSRSFVDREAKTAERLRHSLTGLASIPAGTISGPHASELINVMYEQHLLLKRWLWRRGLVRAADESGLRAIAA